MPRQTAAAATPTSNVDKAKGILGSIGKKKPAANKKETNEKIKLDLPDRLKPGFIRAAGLNQLQKDVEKAGEREKLPLVEFAFDEFLNKLWGAKSRPATMEAEVTDPEGRKDSSANYIVQARYKITFDKPKGDQTPEEVAIKNITDALHAKGMDKDDAEAAATRFVNNELDLAKKPIIDLDKWLRGREEGSGTHKTWVEATPEEQDMASRAVLRLQAKTPKEFNEAPLSDEEVEKLVEYNDTPSVRPGFLERVASYVNSKDQLKVLLTFVKPTNFYSGFLFAENGTPAQKNERKVELAKSVIGLADAVSS